MIYAPRYLDHYGDDEYDLFFKIVSHDPLPNINSLRKSDFKATLAFMKNNIDRALIKISSQTNPETYILVTDSIDDSELKLLFLSSLYQLMEDLQQQSSPIDVKETQSILDEILSQITLLSGETVYSFSDLRNLIKNVWFPVYYAISR